MPNCPEILLLHIIYILKLRTTLLTQFFVMTYPQPIHF